MDAEDGTLAASVYSWDGVPERCPGSPMPRYHVNARTGVPDFVSFGPAGLWLPESAGGSPEQVALAFFERYPLVFGTGDVPRQLRVLSVENESASPFMSHVVLQQTYAGYDVFGAQLQVHLSPGLTITSIGGDYLRDPGIVPVPVVASRMHGTRPSK